MIDLNLVFIVRFCLVSLATYRMAMFTREEGAFGVFGKIRAGLGKLASRKPHGGLAWTLAELSQCPHCAGVWLALVAFPALLWPNIYTDAIIIVLAIAGLQSYLTGRTDGD